MGRKAQALSHSDAVRTPANPERDQVIRIDHPKAPIGLALRITKAGAKSWVLGFMVNRVERRHTLGSLEAWPWPKALAEAQRLRRLVDAGQDPTREKVKPETGLRALSALYIEAKPDKQPLGRIKAFARKQAMFDRFIFPRLGVNRQLADISRSDVATLLRHVRETSGPGSARQVRSALSGLYTWAATKNGYDGPIPFVRGMVEGHIRRQRLFTDAEFVAIWRASYQLQPECRGRYIRMLFRSCVRRSELAFARWSAFGFDARCGYRLILPASIMKFGRHDFLLPVVTPDDLGPQGAPGDFIFGEGVHGFSRLKEALDDALKAAGTPVANYRLHDFRRFARSALSRAGVEWSIAERLLDHEVGDRTSTTYDVFDYAEQRKDALRKLNTLLQDLVSGQEAQRQYFAEQKERDALGLPTDPVWDYGGPAEGAEDVGASAIKTADGW